MTANNFGDMAAARAKGLGTGSTFGAAGSTIDGSYAFSLADQGAAGTRYESSYKHVMHSTMSRERAG